jgi:hypothetical protein
VSASDGRAVFGEVLEGNPCLRSADGAIGAHQRAVHEAYGHFEALAIKVNECHDSVSGLPTLLRILCRLTRGTGNRATR